MRTGTDAIDPLAREECFISALQKQPTIVRIWQGRTSRLRPDEYQAYNYELGIKPLRRKALALQTFQA